VYSTVVIAYLGYEWGQACTQRLKTQQTTFESKIATMMSV